MTPFHLHRMDAKRPGAAESAPPGWPRLRGGHPGGALCAPLRLGGQWGFTLLEVTIALAIVGTALVVLLTSIFNSIQIYRVAESTSTAGVLAQEKFTELLYGKETLHDGKSRSGRFEKHPGYTWSYRASKVEIPGVIEEIPNVLRVVLTVEWEQGRRRQVKVGTFVTLRQRP